MQEIYLDNCLTSKPAPEVIEAMIPYLKDNFHYPKNFVKKGSIISSDIEKYKVEISRTIGAKSSEIHFTTGGTSANNLAIKGLLSANVEKGTHIICSVIDYPDILTNVAFFENSGFDVTYLSVDSEGFIDLEELKNSICDNTILFTTTIANHVVGTIQPMKEIKRILESANHKIYVHVDACEAYGRMPINVDELGIDLMSISAHKINGPQGIGALYNRKGVRLAQVKHGISRLDNLETGGISTALIAGFAKAVELIYKDFNAHLKHLNSISNYLINKIEKEIPFTLFNGARGEKRISHNVNISFEYIEGEAIMVMLDLNGISVATGSACASQGLKANYVMMALGRNHEQSHGSIKFTISTYNTFKEIDLTVEKLIEIVRELRNRSPLYNQRNN